MASDLPAPAPITCLMLLSLLATLAAAAALAAVAATDAARVEAAAVPGAVAAAAGGSPTSIVSPCSNGDCVCAPSAVSCSFSKRVNAVFVCLVVRPANLADRSGLPSLLRRVFSRPEVRPDLVAKVGNVLRESCCCTNTLCAPCS